MKKIKEFNKQLKEISGSILIIGDLSEEINKILDTNSKIEETYWLNSTIFSNDETDDNALDIANDFNLANLHKHLKKGIDTTICNYNEIKKEIPKFIRESLRVTKEKIYIYFDKKISHEMLLNKYKRYKLNCIVEEYEDFNLLTIETNDIVVNEFKEVYYYTLDNLEKLYNNISDNI